MTYKILRALCVFFLLPVIMLSGCQKESQSKEISPDFSADFKAVYRGMELCGHLCSNRQKMLSVKITSPETLGGLEVNYKSSELQIKRDSMICSADEAYIPEESFPNILKTILFAVADGRAELTSSDEKCNTYSLNTAYGKATLKAYPNGGICAAELAESNFKIEFNNLILSNE